jgi:hypothetical protein
MGSPRDSPQGERGCRKRERPDREQRYFISGESSMTSAAPLCIICPLVLLLGTYDECLCWLWLVMTD